MPVEGSCEPDGVSPAGLSADPALKTSLLVPPGTALMSELRWRLFDQPATTACGPGSRYTVELALSGNGITLLSTMTVQSG